MFQNIRLMKERKIIRELLVFSLAIASILGVESKAISQEYAPNCLFSSYTLRFIPRNNAVICQSNYDKNDWHLYEFTKNYDNTYTLSLSVGIDKGDTEYDSTELVSVMLVNGEESPSAIFHIEADGSIVPVEGTNMVIAAFHEEKIEELFRIRALHIGY